MHIKWYLLLMENLVKIWSLMMAIQPIHPRSQLKIKTLQFTHASMTFKTCESSDQDNNQSWPWLSSNETRFFLEHPPLIDDSSVDMPIYVDRGFPSQLCLSGWWSKDNYISIFTHQSSGLSRHSVMFSCSPHVFSVAKNCMILSQMFPWHTFGDASHLLALFYDAQTCPISEVFLGHKHNYKNWYLIITEYNWYILRILIYLYK